MAHVAIMGIGTAVPSHRMEQGDVWRCLAESMWDRPDSARWGKRIFAQCGVEVRYTCEPDLLEAADDCPYIPSSPASRIPTTADRMSLYRNVSVPLAAEAAVRALEDSRIRPSGITHVIVASCTGMFLPGLDAELIRRLDLAPDVHRLPIVFMGCAAGLTAIRIAEAIARANPAAKILVATVELCTLHIQPSFDKEDLYAAAFFGDGASACVIGTADSLEEGGFALRRAAAAFFPGSADKMEWTVGDYGFHLRLSPDIPRLIGQAVPPALDSFRGDEAPPAFWAIHPGGKGIVDAIQAAFRLPDEMVEPSRSVLRNYGNMSSATILFVLDELRKHQLPGAEGCREGIAMAFGPGVSAEFLRLAYYS